MHSIQRLVSLTTFTLLVVATVTTSPVRSQERPSLRTEADFIRAR